MSILQELSHTVLPVWLWVHQSHNHRGSEPFYLSPDLNQFWEGLIPHVPSSSQARGLWWTLEKINALTTVPVLPQLLLNYCSIFFKQALWKTISVQYCNTSLYSFCTLVHLKITTDYLLIFHHMWWICPLTSQRSTQFIFTA